MSKRTGNFACIELVCLTRHEIYRLHDSFEKRHTITRCRWIMPSIVIQFDFATHAFTTRLRGAETRLCKTLNLVKQNLYPGVLPHKKNSTGGRLVGGSPSDSLQGFFFTITASTGVFGGSSPLLEFFMGFFSGSSPLLGWGWWQRGSGFYCCNFNLDTRHYGLPGTCFEQIIVFCFTRSFCFTVKIILQGKYNQVYQTHLSAIAWLMELHCIFVWCLGKCQFIIYLFPLNPRQWIKVLARIMWVTVKCQAKSQRAYPTRGVCDHSPREKFEKLKHFWYIFHDFQPISFMHRLDLRSDASFTLFRKPKNRFKLPVVNASAVLLNSSMIFLDKYDVTN